MALDAKHLPPMLGGSATRKDLEEAGLWEDWVQMYAASFGGGGVPDTNVFKQHVATNPQQGGMRDLGPSAAGGQLTVGQQTSPTQQQAQAQGGTQDQDVDTGDTPISNGAFSPGPYNFNTLPMFGDIAEMFKGGMLTGQQLQ